MKFKKYSFYKSAALASCLMFSTLVSVQAMEDERPAHENGRLPASQKERDKEEERTYNSAIGNLFHENYDLAFKEFLNLAFYGFYKVEDFKNTKDENEYMSKSIQCFGIHEGFPEDIPNKKYQRRYEAFGYVYILWQSNGEGLEKNSALGRAMGKSMENERPQRLISWLSTESLRAKVKKDSNGWILPEN